MPKIIAKIPTKAHPIELDATYEDYLNRSGMKDPESARVAMVRLLREMQPCALRELSHTHIELGVSRLKALGYRHTYIDRTFRAVLAYLSYVHDLGIIASNPAKMVKSLQSDYLFVPKTVDEEHQLAFHTYMLENANHQQLLMWAALTRGARLSEIVMAKVSGIRMDLKEDQPYLEVRTKTAPRIMQMPVWATESLKAVVLAAGDDLEQFILQFPCKNDKQNVRTAYARYVLSNLQIKCFGEVKFNPKEMRSDFITRYLTNAKDPGAVMVVAKQCGNSVDVIQKHYYDFLFQPKDMKGLL